MKREEVQAWAAEFNQTLRCNDPRFCGCVFISTREASHFIGSAFAIEVGEWVVVLSEHDSARVWLREDLLSFQSYEKVAQVKKVRPTSRKVVAKK